MKIKLGIIAAIALAPSAAFADPGLHEFTSATGSDTLAAAVLVAFAVQLGWRMLKALPFGRRAG